MADSYSGRLSGRLVGLANLLDKNGYRTESSMIRSLIGRVNNWKDGYEWNDTNATSIPDADHVLEELVKTFTLAVNEIARKKLVEKQKTEEGEPEENKPAEDVGKAETDKAVQDLETALEGLV